MEEFSLALIWLGFFASIVLGLYFYFSARHKERMALIEKNADVSEIFKPREIRFRFPWLKIGMMIAGVGFGVCLIPFLSSQIPAIYNLRGMGKDIMTMGSMLFFGGLGLVIAYFIEKRKDH